MANRIAKWQIEWQSCIHKLQNSKMNCMAQLQLHNCMAQLHNCMAQMHNCIIAWHNRIMALSNFGGNHPSYKIVRSCFIVILLRLSTHWLPTVTRRHCPLFYARKQTVFSHKKVGNDQPSFNNSRLFSGSCAQKTRLFLGPCALKTRLFSIFSSSQTPWPSKHLHA